MRHNDRAFTLIEVLLGLTIFAVIGVSIYNTFATAVRLNVGIFTNLSKDAGLPRLLGGGFSHQRIAN